MTAFDERTTGQRMEALQKANDTRIRRARLKNDLKSGRTTVTDVIAEPPEYAANMKVSETLGALRGYGRVKVNKLLGVCSVAPSKTLSGLSPRQRRELVRELQRARSHAKVLVAAQALNMSKTVQ